MRELLAELLKSLDAQRPVAYCRLVETRGSTPQKAGATMLVFADGSQAGTLGGGCVEAEVKRKALAALGEGESMIARFDLTSDYGWDDGLICGGRMQVLIEPLTSPVDKSVQRYFEKLAELAGSGRGLIEAIVFDSEKALLPAPSAYLCDEQLRVVASLRAEAISAELPVSVHAGMPNLCKRPRPSAAGGVAYLPQLSRCRLVIVGGGHVGKAVAELAVNLDFDVWVIDDRADIVSQDRFPRAQRRISGKMETVLPGLEIDSNTYCLIVTRGHNHDEEALYHLADRGAAYVGMIGSRRKIRMIFDDLRVEGISPQAIERVHAPVGIDIGSQSVPEIAVSIAAELVAHRNLGSVPGRPSPVDLEASC